jgi:predicted nucleic-acid-binding protein
MADVHARLPELPEVFTQQDLCQTLGYQPDRAVLYRVLRTLLRDETLLVESYGFRRKPTRYRKAGAELSTEPA